MVASNRAMILTSDPRRFLAAHDLAMPRPDSIVVESDGSYRVTLYADDKADGDRPGTCKAMVRDPAWATPTTGVPTRYAFDVRLGPDWPYEDGGQDSRALVAQWKSGSGSGSFSLMTQGPNWIVNAMGDPRGTPIVAPILRDDWNRFEAEAMWSAKSQPDGYLTLRLNGEEVYRIDDWMNIREMPHVPRFWVGIYRPAWEHGPQPGPQVRRLWVRNVTTEF